MWQKLRKILSRPYILLLGGLEVVKIMAACVIIQERIAFCGVVIFLMCSYPLCSAKKRVILKQEFTCTARLTTVIYIGKY